MVKTANEVIQRQNFESIQNIVNSCGGKSETTVQRQTDRVQTSVPKTTVLGNSTYHQRRSDMFFF